MKAQKEKEFLENEKNAPINPQSERGSKILPEQGFRKSSLNSRQNEISNRTRMTAGNDPQNISPRDTQ